VRQALLSCCDCDDLLHHLVTHLRDCCLLLLVEFIHVLGLIVLATLDILTLLPDGLQLIHNLLQLLRVVGLVDHCVLAEVVLVTVGKIHTRCDTQLFHFPSKNGYLSCLLCRVGIDKLELLIQVRFGRFGDILEQLFGQLWIDKKFVGGAELFEVMDQLMHGNHLAIGFLVLLLNAMKGVTVFGERTDHMSLLLDCEKGVDSVAIFVLVHSGDSAIQKKDGVTQGGLGIIILYNCGDINFTEDVTKCIESWTCAVKLVLFLEGDVHLSNWCLAGMPGDGS